VEGREPITILFIAGFGPVVRDVATRRKLYGETLGIPFKEEGGGYLHTEALKGRKKLRAPATAASGAVMLREGFLAR
jgi:hypothetical protein